MDVSPARPRQFSRDGLLEQNLSEQWIDIQKKKPLYKENSELWKTYRRLTSSQVENIGSKKLHGNSLSTTIDYPDRDGMKCMCYENLMRIIKDSANIPPPVVYRVPSRKPPRLGLDSVRPTWMKKAIEEYKEKRKLQFPLATISVRWQQKRTLLNYDLSKLWSIFERFGTVVDIRMISSNSCIVIFEEIVTACNVMQSKCLGNPLNILHCSWWHKSMANKSVVARAKGVSVRTDTFLL